MNMSKTSLPLDKNIPILIVDHLPMVRRMVKNCLRQLGFENVHEAEDGAKAIECLGSENFSLVISDSEMPDMKPAELVTHLRRKQNSDDAPVLFIASATSKNTKPVNYDHTGVIVKPFTAQQIGAKLASMLGAEK